MDSINKRKKLGKKSRVKHAEGSEVLKALGSTRSAPLPPTEVPPAVWPLRPSPLHYNTPTDLPNTIEELLVQVPEYQEVPPPQEEIVEEKEREEGFWMEFATNSIQLA